MPKETIAGNLGESLIHVGWANDDDMQIVVTFPKAMVDAGPGDYFAVARSLDRASVNKLIRVLRRARDAVFGADQ